MLITRQITYVTQRYIKDFVIYWLIKYTDNRIKNLHGKRTKERGALNGQKTLVLYSSLTYLTYFRPFLPREDKH